MSGEIFTSETGYKSKPKDPAPDMMEFARLKEIAVTLRLVMKHREAVKEDVDTDYEYKRTLYLFAHRVAELPTPVDFWDLKRLKEIAVALRLVMERREDFKEDVGSGFEFKKAFYLFVHQVAELPIRD